MSIQKAVLRRNFKRKKLIEKYSETRKISVQKLRSSNSLKDIIDSYKEIYKIPRDAFPSRYRNRCSINGRGRAVFRKFGICRHKILELCSLGLIYGWKSSSW